MNNIEKISIQQDVKVIEFVSPDISWIGRTIFLEGDIVTGIRGLGLKINSFCKEIIDPQMLRELKQADGGLATAHEVGVNDGFSDIDRVENMTKGTQNMLTPQFYEQLREFGVYSSSAPGFPDPEKAMLPNFFHRTLEYQTPSKNYYTQNCTGTRSASPYDMSLQVEETFKKARFL